MYIGHGRDQTRPGTYINGLILEHCVARRCGWDGFQVRMCRDAVVCENEAYDIGFGVGTTGQGGAGFIAGTDTGGVFSHNVVERADRGFLLLKHLSGLEVSYNLVLDCGGVRDNGGIQQQTGAKALMQRNTVVGSARYGIRIKVDDTPANQTTLVRDNFVVETAGDPIVARNEDHNALAGTVGAARFVDPETGDYSLLSDSPAVGAASDGGDCGAFPHDGPEPEPPPDVDLDEVARLVEVAQVALDEVQALLEGDNGG
jgi:hypothetical protein